MAMQAGLKAQVQAVGFTEEESAQLATLESSVVQRLLVLVKTYGLPAVRAALPFILVGDWLGALEAVLKLIAH